MRSMILAMSAVALLASASAASAGGSYNPEFQSWKNDCVANGATDIRQVNGEWKCDPPGAKHSAPISSDPAFVAFKADCDAHGGTIYTAEEWNQKGIPPRLPRGDFQCYKGPSYTVN